MTHQCKQCRRHSVEVPMFLARKGGGNTPLRCRMCGAVHTSYDGSLISPPMHPLSAGGRLSPWMLPWERPHLDGSYECRFRDIEPSVVVLSWHGASRRWLHKGEQVSEKDFLTWRGVWL